MSTIVVGMDESPDAAAALNWAIEEASIRKSIVRATMCWSYLDQHDVNDTAFDPAYGEDAAHAALDEIVAQAVEPSIAVTIEKEVVNDLPAAGLLASSADADMLVLGARGMGELKELVVGSASRQCLHHSTVPVAIVRMGTEARGPFGRVVVGVDGSAASRRALDWALDEARSRNACVTVVHTWAPVVVGGLYAIAPMVNVAKLELSAHSLASELVAHADTSGLPPIEYTIVAARPGDALVSEAIDADLVVVGSRGIGGFRELLLGSTSHHVAHHAPCPVVVIPHDRT